MWSCLGIGFSLGWGTAGSTGTQACERTPPLGRLAGTVVGWSLKPTRLPGEHDRVLPNTVRPCSPRALLTHHPRGDTLPGSRGFALDTILRTRCGERAMLRNPVLLIDALINLFLGGLLLTFPSGIVELLGIPKTEQSFYPSILGAVLIGIGLALLLECFGRPKGLVGLGLGGAVAINLCGGIVLGTWLASGRLIIPLRGQAVLWGLVAILVVISATELHAHRRRLINARASPPP
jgi:hypothetical protein